MTTRTARKYSLTTYTPSSGSKSEVGNWADGRYRNARNSVHLLTVRDSVIREQVQKWQGTCDAYNKAYWDAVEEIADAVVRETCPDKPELGEIVM